MAVESTSDLNSFFDADEFGTAATYAPAVGSPVSIVGIFDNDFVEIEIGRAHV